MKLVSWNVNGSPHVEAQAAALLSGSSPDLVALQEVRRGTVAAWKRELKDKGGFGEGQVHTTEHLVGDRTNFLVTACKFSPVTSRAKRRAPSLDFEVPFPELVLSVVLSIDDHYQLELVNTHVPNGSSNGYRKVEHFEGLYRYLSRTWSPNGRPRVLCGDFNSPREEKEDGTVLTWGQAHNGNLEKDRGQRWDAAERSVILGLKAFDLVDVYRREQGYAPEANAVSWVPARRKDSRLTPEQHDQEFGRRFDHIFIPPEFSVNDCAYREEWRKGESRLSDHAAIWVDVDWP
jgi:exonuclease III